MRAAATHLSILLLATSIAACTSPNEEGVIEILGSVEKGPLLTGSTVLVSGGETGDAHLTRTINDAGDFALEIPHSWSDEYFDLTRHRDSGQHRGYCHQPTFWTFEASGFYYNEITGDLSVAPIVLRASMNSLAEPIVDGSPVDAHPLNVHVNILTHLIFERIDRNFCDIGAVEPPPGPVPSDWPNYFCIDIGPSPRHDYALGELMNALEIGPNGYRGVAPCALPAGMVASGVQIVGEATDAAAYLLAVSAIFIQAAQNRGGPLDATLQELLNTTSRDLADDGELEPELVDELHVAEGDLDTTAIAEAFRVRLHEIGSDGAMPHLDSMIDSDRDGHVNADDCMPRDPERWTGEADLDGDGHDHPDCGGDDCDDDDPLRYPGATEVCDVDDVDEDCDPSTFGFRDGDSDGAPDSACCNDDGEGGQICGTDCDDAAPLVCPSCPEVPGNDVDDDCDGVVDEGDGPARWDQPAGSASLWIVVDDSANATYLDGQLLWRGSFIYDEATNVVTYNATWDGPFAPLYDDGPWTAGGHEAAGQTAGDHILSAEVFFVADGASETTFLYGMINEDGWIWPGDPSTFVVPAGSTDRFEAPGMTVEAFGDVDFRVELDTSALHANFLPFDPPRHVGFRTGLNGWRIVEVLDDGGAGDAVAGDGIYSMLWSRYWGPHGGPVSVGDLVQFVWQFDDGLPGAEDYRDDGTGCVEGVTIFSEDHTGAFTEEVMDYYFSNTAFTVGP